MLSRSHPLLDRLPPSPAMAASATPRILNLLPSTNTNLNPSSNGNKPYPNQSPRNIAHPLSSAAPRPQLLPMDASPLLTTAATAITFSLPLFLNPQDALAVDGEFGILEGRSFALVHPVVMGSLFVYTLWAGYLGWQWRRVRTIQNEINELKKQVRAPASATPVAAGAEFGAPPPPLPLSPVEVKIQQLTEERKALVKGSYRERHYNAGSILLGFGVLEAVGGCLNTWFRTGKLFPGPHLFAGAGITVLWALAAALVPAMQKGNETARNLHIALNALNVLLFASQIPTGIEIVFKVLEFTKWP